MEPYSMVIRKTFVLIAIGLAGLSTQVRADDASKSPLKVFVLVGQSNMEGKGTIIHLEEVVTTNADAYGHLKSNGKWVERDDVWIDFLGDQGRRRKGRLTVGYGNPEDRIGPELGFGNRVDEAFEAPVLIIKYAVGGRAIAMEFRPPSSGPMELSTIPDEELRQAIENGEIKPGDEYRKMMAHIKDVLEHIKESPPGDKAGPVELAGFVWFQGWNDQYNNFDKYYQKNMANFIRDVRKDLESPNLPFVIGGMGQGGEQPIFRSAIIRKAQRATAEMDEFKSNNVRYVSTALYWRDGEQGDGEYHYNGNAEIFLLIGRAFADATLDMQPSGENNDKSTPQSVEAVRFDPIVQRIEGWTVHVDPQMLAGAHRHAGAEALKMLANHLQRIAVLVPEEQLIKMRQLEIWIEHHHPTLGAMQYHPSVGWLNSHGHDPRLARKVHIPRANSLLSRQQMIKHPAVVLHELAHAYHDQYLSFDNPRIIEVYDQAMATGLYDQALLYTGATVRHYGATNHKEYFAEGTESFFYRNDFYPFVAAELQVHNPVFYDLLVETWGSLK